MKCEIRAMKCYILIQFGFASRSHSHNRQYTGQCSSKRLYRRAIPARRQCKDAFSILMAS